MGALSPHTRGRRVNAHLCGMHIRLVVALATLAAPALSAHAYATEPPATYNGRSNQTTLSPPKVSGAVKVDGRLDEAAWLEASLLTGFSQYSPVDGIAAADSTEVLVMYTDHAVYFGIRAFETHGPVHASHADRDKIGADDNVQLLLDTFRDRRRAYSIAVNPLGIQSDGIFSDNSGADLNPDFQFESKGNVTAYGYEVEIRVPFKSIRFQQAKSQNWGINVIRRVQHSGHEQTWTRVARGAPSFLAQSGTLENLSALKRGLVLDINPVVTQRTTGSRATTQWDYDAERPQFGGNASWGLTSNLALNATIKPDFSQVEADVGQVVFDPRQALFFPDKRPFFLEGSENFSVPNSLIYTRTIVAPEAALKLSGKMGGLNVGVLSAIDGAPPGSDRPIYNIARFRRDLGGQSHLGMVYTDRVEGESFNRVVGMDARTLFGKRYILNGQFATSFTGGGGKALSSRPLFDVSLLQTGRSSGFTFLLKAIHPEFVASSGFLSRVDVAHMNFTPRKTWFPSSGIFESVSFTPIIDGTWTWDRFTRGTEPNDIKFNSSTSALLKGGWRTGIYTWTESFKYPDYLYGNLFLERRTNGGAVTDTVAFSGTDRLTNLGAMFTFGTPQWRAFSGSAEIVGGQDDNFDEWSSALILYSTLNADWRPTDRFRVNARYVEQRTHRKSDRTLVRLRSIPRIKVEYQVTRPLFVRFVGQHDATKIDALRDDSRTDAPILIRGSDGVLRQSTAQERSRFRADWLLSFQPNPGTVLFAGYGASLGTAQFFSPRELERTSDGFFVKVSYLLRR